jgi:glycosyltransferase involved in cell wall biosynthesis
MGDRVRRVLWVTNMLYAPGAPTARGIFVTQQRDALLATGAVEIETEVVAQGRGVTDYLRAIGRVRARLDRSDFDLVHVHYGLTGLATLAIPSSKPLVFTFYGSDLNDAVQRTISFATARRARRRIFVARRLADLWPHPDHVILPNGVDFEACAPQPREEACRLLGLDPGRPRVLFGARPDNETKGHVIFREVLERVRRRVPVAEELVLTEPGQSYEQVVTKLNAADVLLFTSRRGTEGSPTVIKEALAVGLPVVSVDVGDAAEMLDGVSPGGVVPWAEGGAPPVEGLAVRVQAILAEARRSDGREKRGFLRQERIAARLLEVYEAALSP